MLDYVFGDNTISRAHVFDFHKRFSEGSEEVGDDERPVGGGGKVQKISRIVRTDGPQSTQMIADVLSTTKETVRQIKKH